jgi:hypothetical protein
LHSHLLRETLFELSLGAFDGNGVVGHGNLYTGWYRDRYFSDSGHCFTR